jgi:nucleotide-binding universal stress UspA family protein
LKRRIVIGYDPEQQGDDALCLGGLMAELLAADPIVAVVTRWHEQLLDREPLEAAVASEVAGPRERAEAVLDSMKPEVRGFAWRSPASALHDVAVAERAAMIVLGSAHRGPLGRLALGSVGESLLHGAPCAVAVAPRGYADKDERHLLEIAIAFDGSPEAWSALDAAIGITERTHGRLTVVTVADYSYYGYASSWSILSAGEFHDVEQESKQRIVDLALSRIPAAVPKEGRLLTGDAGALLADASGDFDLMVTGSRGYGPLRRTLLGTATRKLMRSGACPALVLPRAAVSRSLGLGTPERTPRRRESTV